MNRREVRRTENAVQRARPALVSGSGVGPFVGSGGQGGSVDMGEVLFLAEVTDVTGLGIDARYEFRERRIAGRGAGGVVEKVGGRWNHIDVTPARYTAGGTLEAGDLVLVRRNPGDVNEWEIVAMVGKTAGSSGSSGGGAGGGASFCFTIHSNPRCEDGRLVYDEQTVCLYGAVFGEVV